MTPRKMFILTLILALSVSGMAFAQGKIVGGYPAQLSNWPWIVGLVVDGSGLCGGTLISSNWVLTAAHCVHGATSIEVRTNTTNLYSPGETILSKRLIAHPNYTPSTFDNDIALIELSQASAVTPNSSWGGTPQEGVMASVAGWGTTSEGGDASITQLLQVEVPVVSNATCNQSYNGAITGNMVCAGLSEGGKDSCQGDSGGPLVQNGSLIGVVSFGNGCARPGFYGVYARVANYTSWVQSYTGTTPPTTPTPTPPGTPTPAPGPVGSVVGWWPGLTPPTNVGVKIELGTAQSGWYWGGSLVDLVNQVGGKAGTIEE